MDDKLPITNGKGMHVADGQIIHGAFTRHDFQANYCSGPAIQQLDFIAQVQLTGCDPSFGGQPGMFLGGVNDLCLNGRSMAAVTCHFDLLLLCLAAIRLTARSRQSERDIDQVGIVIDEDLLDCLGGDGLCGRVIGLNLVSYLERTDGHFTVGRCNGSIRPKGEATGRACKNFSVS